MRMPPTIRRVTPADGAAALALRLEMLADTPLAFIVTLAECAAQGLAAYTWRVARGATGGVDATFVAEVRDGRQVRLVGQAGAYAHPSAPDHTVLYAVYISPAHRGAGLLGGLVDAVAEWSREQGRPRLELDVVTTNSRAARAYAKLGFSNVGGPIAHPTIGPLREQRMERPA